MIATQSQQEILTLPVAYGQEAFWLLHQADPHNIAYNTATALHVQTPLPTRVWRSLFQRLVQRHPALRTTFAFHDGQTVQIVQATQPVDLEAVDCTGQSWAELMQGVEAAIHRPYDLEQGPLFRVFLFSQNATSQVVLICSHHIINDGFSQWMLLDELLTLYALDQGTESTPLPPMHYSYPRFVEWQHAFVAEQGETMRAWWQQHLAGEMPVLDLPTDFPRPVHPSTRLQALPYRLSSELRDQMRTLARRCGVSFYTVLLASFQVLLHRYSGQSEIVVGVPTVRRGPEDAQTFGYFVNPVTVRGKLENIPFTAFLRQIGEQLTAAAEHRDYPFSLLTQALPLRYDRNRTSIYRASVVSQQLRDLGEKGMHLLNGEDLQVADLHCRFLSWWPGGNDLDISLDLMARSEGMVGYLRYNSDLFTAATIERMGGHYQQLLAAIVAEPETKLAQLPLLTAAEYQQLIYDWNATAVAFPQDKLVHQLVEEQAARIPAATAVIFGDEQLTYGELNARANQLAHYLRAAGVGPGTLVSLCLERSLEMVVGVLGILKAGGAYVPLDPTYPPERLAFMLADAQTPLVLTVAHLAATLPDTGVQRLCLDRDWETIASYSDQNPTNQTRLTDLVYMIYTSGSTGQPKGVLIPHQGLLNLVFWQQQLFTITAQDHATQLASLSFDAAAWEIWSYLTAGATLHLVPADLVTDPERLQVWLLARGITCCFVPTPVAEQIILLPWPQQTTLRFMATGGDKLHSAPPVSLPFALVNGYGPTENSVVTTATIVPPGLPGAPSIGRPIANVQTYILDAHGQPVPIGVPGELYVAGAGLAQGYHNRPALTAEKFVVNPFGAGYCYRTGDLVRYTPTGAIEFLGRIDHQVKIRGFRIELGEITATLQQHPAVREAIVVAREDAALGGGAKQVVAYVVLTHQPGNPAPSSRVAELQRFLKSKLPYYMVPAAMIALDALPLTPNGKVDRHALPAPDHAYLAKPIATPPRTTTERKLAEIWGELLGLTQIDVQDNFFEIGGHSLLASRIINRSCAAFQVQLSLRALFTTPTIAGLAEQIEQLLLVQALQQHIEVETEEQREEIAL